MPKTILVTGGTGTLGRHVVPRLLRARYHVGILSRKPRQPEAGGVGWAAGDLRTGNGIGAAVTGVDVIVHCATAARGDIDSARHLLDAARRAGSPHLIYISIVAVDEIPLGYYKTKLDVERLVADSDLPFTILRATQFHDLPVRTFAAQRRLPVLLVPTRTSFQPIDASEVADRLIELALTDPAGRVTDLGGPEIRDAGDLADTYLHTLTRRRGGHLTPEHAAGHITFEQHLATRTSGTSAP